MDASVRAGAAVGNKEAGEAFGTNSTFHLPPDVESDIKGLWDLGGLYVDLEESLGKGVDIVSLAGLEHLEQVRMNPGFADAVRHEMVQVYAREG